MDKEEDQDDETPTSIGVGRYPCMPSLVALQQMRNRLHLAYLGKKLMKWTALATGRELRKIATNLNESYEDFHDDLADAYMLLARSRYYYPNLNKMVLEDVQKEAHVTLKTTTRTVSGVRVIQFEIGGTPTTPYPHLGIDKGGQHIKDTKQTWENLLKRMILILELRESFSSVEYAHKTATKKQNVLSKVIIPKLTTTLAYILSELEEREREDNFRLKRFKQLKMKKAAIPKIKLCTCCARYFRCDVDQKEPVCEICSKALRLGPSDIPIQYIPCANVGKQLLEYLDTHMDDIKALAKMYPGKTCCTTEGTASCIPPMSLLPPPPPPKVEAPPKVVTPPSVTPPPIPSPEKVVTPPKEATPPPEPEPEPVVEAPPPPPTPPVPLGSDFVFKQRQQMVDFKRPVLKPPKVIKVPLAPCQVRQLPCSVPPAERPCRAPCTPAPDEAPCKAPCGAVPPPAKIPCAAHPVPLPPPPETLKPCATCSLSPELIGVPCSTPASKAPCSSKASAKTLPHAPCPTMATKPRIPQTVTPCASCQASADKLMEAAYTLNRVVDKLLAYKTPCASAELSKPCGVRSVTSEQQKSKPCSICSSDAQLEASCLSFCSIHRLLKPCIQCSAELMPNTAKLMKETQPYIAKQYPSGDTIHDSSLSKKPDSQRPNLILPQSYSSSLKTNIKVITSSDKSASASLRVTSSTTSHRVTPKISHPSQTNKGQREMKSCNSVEVTEKIIKLKKIFKLDGSVSEEKRIIIRTERTMSNKEHWKNVGKIEGDSYHDKKPPGDKSGKKKPETADKACDTGDDFGPEYPRTSFSSHQHLPNQRPTHPLGSRHPCEACHPHQKPTHPPIHHPHCINHDQPTYPPGSTHDLFSSHPSQPHQKPTHLPGSKHDLKTSHPPIHHPHCINHDRPTYPPGSTHDLFSSHPCQPHQKPTQLPGSKHDSKTSHPPIHHPHCINHDQPTYPPGSTHDLFSSHPCQPHQKPTLPGSKHDSKTSHPPIHHPHCINHDRPTYPPGSTHDLFSSHPKSVDYKTDLKPAGDSELCICPQDKEVVLLKKIRENVETTIRRLKDASTSTSAHVSPCESGSHSKKISKTISSKSEQVKGVCQMYDPKLRPCISEPVPSTSRSEAPETCNSSLSTDNIYFKSKTIQEAKSRIPPKDKKKGSKSDHVCKTDVCDCKTKKSVVNICIQSPKYLTAKSMQLKETDADNETITFSIASDANEIVITEPRIVISKLHMPKQKSQNVCSHEHKDKKPPCQCPDSNKSHKQVFDQKCTVSKPIAPCQFKNNVIGDNRRASDVTFGDVLPLKSAAKSGAPERPLVKIVGPTMENDHLKEKCKFRQVRDSCSQLRYNSKNYAEENIEKKIRTINKPIDDKGYTVDCRKIRSCHAEDKAKQVNIKSNAARSSSANDVKLGETICKNCLMEICGYAPPKTVIKLEELSKHCRICQMKWDTIQKANSNAKNSTVPSESYHSCRSMSLDGDSHICIDLAGSYPSVSKNSCCDDCGTTHNTKSKCDPMCKSAFVKEKETAIDANKAKTQTTTNNNSQIIEVNSNFERFNTLMKRLDEDLERNAMLADLYSGVATRAAASVPSVNDPEEHKEEVEGTPTKTIDKKPDTVKEPCRLAERALYRRVRANDPTLFVNKESHESNKCKDKDKEKPKGNDKTCKCCTTKPFYCNHTADACCKSESCVLNAVKLLSALDSTTCSIDPSSASNPCSKETTSETDTDPSLESYEKPDQDTNAALVNASTEVQEKIFAITETFSQSVLDEISKEFDACYSMSFENIIRPGGKPCRSAPMATDNITRLYTRTEKPPPCSQIDGRPDNITGNEANKDAATNTKRSTRYDVRSISNFPSKPGNKISKSSVPSTKIIISRTLNESCSCHNIHANSKARDTRQCKSYEDLNRKKE